MSISAGSLYRETAYFLRYQLSTIVLIALVSAFSSMIMVYVLFPNTEQLMLLEGSSRSSHLLEKMQNMTREQNQVLLHVAAVGTFASLVGNVLLLGGMISLISKVTARESVSALHAIGASVPFLPRLLLLTFLATLLIELGFILLMVPGVILTIMLALAPIILVSEKKGIFSSMYASIRLVQSQIKLIAPAVILWLLAKVLLLLLTMSFTVLPMHVASIVFNTLSNLTSAALIIYLSRLYMLIR